MDKQIYNIESEDSEMNKAIIIANQTLNEFKSALETENTNFHSFALKVRYETEKGGEHIWISYIEIRNGKFVGFIDNSPESTQEVKLNDLIEIDSDQITDWLYLDKENLKGGFTIRILRNRMTEKERKEFDEYCGFVIE